MMVCCDESLKSDYSKILPISSASDTFTIFLFSIFLSFSLLDIFQINLHYIFILSTALSFHIDLRSHTRVLCLPLFLIFWFLFLYLYPFGDSLVRSFPVGIRSWLVCPSSTLRVGWSVPLFSRTSQLSLYCQHTKLQVIKSLSHLYREFALV